MINFKVFFIIITKARIYLNISQRGNAQDLQLNKLYAAINLFLTIICFADRSLLRRTPESRSQKISKKKLQKLQITIDSLSYICYNCYIERR